MSKPKAYIVGFSGGACVLVMSVAMGYGCMYWCIVEPLQEVSEIVFVYQSRREETLNSKDPLQSELLFVRRLLL